MHKTIFNLIDGYFKSINYVKQLIINNMIVGFLKDTM